MLSWRVYKFMLPYLLCIMYFIFSVSTAYAPFKNTGDYPQILYLTFKLFIIPSPLEDVLKYL